MEDMKGWKWIYIYHTLSDFWFIGKDRSKNSPFGAEKKLFLHVDVTTMVKRDPGRRNETLRV